MRSDVIALSQQFGIICSDATTSISWYEYIATIHTKQLLVKHSPLLALPTLLQGLHASGLIWVCHVSAYIQSQQLDDEVSDDVLTLALSRC